MKKRKRKSVKTLAASKRVRRAVKRFGQSPSSVEDTKNSEKKKKRKQKAREREEEEEEASNAIVQCKKAKAKISAQLSAIRKCEVYVDAYQQDGWRSSNREKLKPREEILKKQKEVFERKLRVRELFTMLEYDVMKREKYRVIESSVDGEIECEDVFCCECGEKECFDENDIVFCDGYCDLAFHCKCVALKKIPDDDEDWLCPICDCRVDVVYWLNLDHSQKLDILTCTHLDVFAREHEMFVKGIIPGTARFLLHGENEEDQWPDDESEDEDFKETNEEDDGKDDSDISLSGSAIKQSSSSSSESSASSSSSSDSAEIIVGPRKRTKVDYVKLNGDLFGDQYLDGDEEGEKIDKKIKREVLKTASQKASSFSVLRR